MSRLQRVSEYLQLNPDKLKKLGIYDGYVNIDSNVYIHPKLLMNCNVTQLKESENKILKHFGRTIQLLKNVKQFNDKDISWKILKGHFHFPEPKGVALGISLTTTNGKGLTGAVAENSLQSLKQLIDTGIDDPYMFQLLGLIQENIGVDRISDMLVNILYDDLLIYTEDMMKKLGVQELEKVTYRGKNYMIKTRPNGENLIFVPENIVSTIPSCAGYEDLQAVIDANREVKEKIFEMFGEANIRNIKDEKEKQLLFEIVNNKAIWGQVISNVKEKQVLPYDFDIDPNGIHIPVMKMQETFLKNPEILISEISNDKTLFEKVGSIINHFKFIIEHKGLNQELYYTIETSNGQKRKMARDEMTSHRLFIAILETLSQIYEVDYTYEPKVNRGEVDFRFINLKNPNEIVLVEFKLNSHSDLVHGYNSQLSKYMVEHKTEEAYYVIVEVVQNKSIENFDNAIPTRNAKKGVIYIRGMLEPSPSKKVPKKKKS